MHVCMCVCVSVCVCLFFCQLGRLYIYHTGRYYYIETSSRPRGLKARMSTSSLVGGETMCLQFWYHATGPHVGELHVYHKANPASNTPTETSLFDRK